MESSFSPVILALGSMLATFDLAVAPAAAVADDAATPHATLTGKDALGDWTTDAPGVRRKITLADLATPYETPSANNYPRVVRRPQGAWPKAPEGFKVTEFATGLVEPRVIVRAPNGDLFVAESAANRVRVFRDADGDGKPEMSEVFATGLDRPFGIAFYPPGPEPKYVYVGNTGSVVRFPYQNGDTKARGQAEMIVADIPTGNEQVGGGGHWTRDLEFSPDGKTLFVSVGSRSNVSDDASEKRRADILAFDPDGKNERIFAWGIRNAVGLATHPADRRALGLGQRARRAGRPPRARLHHPHQGGGFYGWPWYYLGPNQDPRHKGKHPELKDKVIVPDVLVQSHSASLDMTFYNGTPVPDGVPARRIRRRARLVEPRPPDRLQGDPRPDEGRQGDGRVRGLPRRVRHPGRRRLGPAGRRGRGQGRRAARHRRRLGHGVAGRFRRQVIAVLRRQSLCSAVQASPGPA